jgi:hypothetical protein
VVTLADLREKYGRVPDEDLILLSIVGDDAVDVVGSADAPRPAPPADTPLLELIGHLAETDRHAFVAVSRPGLSVTLRKKAQSGPDRP